MNYPKNIEKAIESLSLLPGVGKKSAERYALALLSLNQNQLQQFIDDVTGLQNVHICQQCGNYADGELCPICKDDSRNKNVICVVSSSKDLIAIENARIFDGVYHVLNGVLSTSKGVFPEDIGLDKLFTRIRNENIKEIILATPLTLDGEMTALYIDKKLNGTDVLVTRIARGMPMGGQIDYADQTTLQQAFSGRKKVTNE